MAEFRLKKGYDIPLAGTANKELDVRKASSKIAVLPSEFRGIKPRLNVKEGDQVEIGSVLFSDKQNPDIKIVSPVSGKVSAINRGERRMLLEIVVENDGKETAISFGNWSAEDLKKLDASAVKDALLNGGMWPHILQRPFNLIADPQTAPRDIFISGFDTAPLAAKIGFLLKDKLDDFQTGINMLAKLTSGKVYLSVPKSDSLLNQITGVELNVFSGPHPAGNVGVQIHHIKPLNRGESVWQLNASAVASIGRFFTSGIFPTERIVALAGPSLIDPKYVKCTSGVPIADLIPAENVKSGEVRYISGNVLTGLKTFPSSYLGFYNNLITVLPEAEHKRKFLGYARLGLKTVSFSKTFLSKLIPGKAKYALDTKMNGGKRAFVMSASDYEKVMPMDILPVQLAKSILAKDIEEMEGLGILELAEEDVALCSYICLSKMDFGKLLRDGLEMIQLEG